MKKRLLEKDPSDDTNKKHSKDRFEFNDHEDDNDYGGGPSAKKQSLHFTSDDYYAVGLYFILQDINY